MTYRIEFTASAQDELAALPRKIQRQISQKIDSLAEDPRPAQSKRLEGKSHIYRLRSGDYRVLYQIRDKLLLVLVIRVGHRREVYRRVPDK